MTYKELYESAIDKLEKSKITLGKFEKMIEPLNAEIATAETDTISRQLRDLQSEQQEKQHGRIFQEIVVESPTISTYLEYKGKPYFSIKYTENGQGFIGYGTYSPEVLSGYLKEYFMPPAEPHWIPVTERLPEVGETVLFCDYDRDIYVGHRAIEHWWSVDDKVKNVIAWMPLLEPYKGVTE